MSQILPTPGMFGESSEGDPIGIHQDFRYQKTRIPIAVVRRWLRHDKFILFH